MQVPWDSLLGNMSRSQLIALILTMDLPMTNMIEHTVDGDITVITL